MAHDSNVNTESELIRKRGTIKAKLTSFTNFLNDFDDSNPAHIHQLRMRIAKLERDFESFETIQDALELVASETQYESRLTERCEFQETYYNSITIAQHTLETVDKSQQAALREKLGITAPTTESHTEPTRSEGVAQPTGLANAMPTLESPLTIASEIHVKVPTMHLPKFSGSYQAWPGFADAFRSAIHENPNFRDAQKLVYLRSCLAGKAAEKIESLETTAANYSVAWNILERYYNDPTIVINNRIQAFFELPSCSRSNVDSLGELVDQATKHYRALQALNQPFLEAFPIYAVTSKLDEATRLKWKEQAHGRTLPSMEELLEFLHNRRKLLEDPNEGSNNRVVGKFVRQTRSSGRIAGGSNNRGSQVVNVAYPAINVTCHLCKDKHFTSACPKIKNTELNQRLSLVKNAGLCINCLQPNHTAKECVAGSCKRCKGTHHTLLHKEPNTEGQARTQVNISSLTSNIGTETLLSTAIVYLLNNKGQPQPCRLLLDSGSQSHFLTERAASRLKLPQTKVDIPVIGINKATTNIKNSVKTRLQSRINKYQVDTTFLIIPHITDTIPSRKFSKFELAIPKHLPLADPKFDTPSEVDGLIGAELFLQLLCVGQINLANNAVTLQKTKVGWILAGRLPGEGITQPLHCNLMRESVQDQLAKFWEVEEPVPCKLSSQEEFKAEEHYASNTTRDSLTGKYIVRLPFKESAQRLGESYSTALRRLRSLEQKFARNTELRAKYAEFLKEYFELGHMSAVETDPTNDGYYLPHHAVFKQCSVTTKLRVVFDASAKTANGISLNDNLLVGPTIQEDLYSLLVRFRSHSYVLTADIEKMYRQVLIHPSDRKYQQILWRANPQDRIKTYTLNTVTYGTSAAPFLAVRSLHQLAYDEQNTFPHASKLLREDLYVDDVLTGANTYQEAITIRDELIQLCKKGGFTLRQWASNDKTLIESVENQADAAHLRLDLDSTVKTLGISWDAKNDDIVYHIRDFDHTTKVTKRIILSQIASLFDPLGLLGPIIVRAKILMQQLWKLQLNWDESVPSDIHTTWITFCEELKLLEALRVRRQTTCKNATSFELHGFSDASEQAYGACIYIRSINKNNTITSQLVSAKSRVAPLKTVTLPRLELCAAHLLSKLFETTINALRRTPFSRIVFWSDSTIALHWIRRPPHTLKTFVAHRVAEIQAVTTNFEWRHVPSKENPADLLSRGSSTQDFTNNALWFNGPSWLSHSESHWPITRLEPIEVPETRKVISLPTRLPNWNALENFSSYSKLKRVVAYILRFRFNSSRKENNKGILSVAEIHRAEQYIVRTVQGQAYPQELQTLKGTGNLRGPLVPLNPFIDTDGILRVGGRLSKSNLRYNTKHPILLPKNHHVSNLVISEQHIQNFHAGIQATLNAVRQKFWIPNGKGTIRRLLHKCVTCFKAKPPIVDYKMSDLPASRVTYSRPFKQSGVDFCGPIFIKERVQRNRGKVKVYLAIFVCFCTRAVHIEIVNDLTTEACLAALRRFFARRGLASDIYSDNATNFVGAKREIRELYAFITSSANTSIITTALANIGIKWHTIPPRSPYFGGLWEAAVRRTKYHLTRVIGDTLLSYEALLTSVTQVEAILNSRPITPLSSDPNDLQALTPSHFLIGEVLTSVPDYDSTAIPTARLSSWEHVQQMRKHFWNRWIKDYLQEQTTRTKWRTHGTTDITVGTLVIIREDNTPPMSWPIGRITAIHPGDDGIVRVATVKTAHGEYKRCVKRLAPLPLYN